MKNMHKLKVLALSLVLLLGGGCSRSKSEVMEDTRTAGRYMGRGVRSLFGKQGDSRQVRSQAEFATHDEDEFIPLEDEGLYRQLTMGDVDALKEIDADSRVRQAAESPGDPGSEIPGIDGFYTPDGHGDLASVFRNIHFPYNSNLIKGEDNLKRIKAIASYLKRHPNTFIFVEGHCDERGPAAYNLALGSRRANAVRNLLIREGVDLNHIFTISYGKERPLVAGHDESFWSKNRRAQFRLYDRGA